MDDTLTRRPCRRALNGEAKELRGRGQRRADVEHHGNVGAEQLLHFDGLLRCKPVERAVVDALECHAVVVDFDGYAIGGLSVGESRDEMLPAIEATNAVLPADRPRYLLGVGDPISLIEGVGRGVDMFDCVLPTRLARHGTVLTSEGRVQMKNARFARDPGPLDPACSCETCIRYSRAYLRHLQMVGEQTVATLLTIHNLTYLLSLMRRARTAIIDGTFAALRSEVAATWF